MLRLLSLLLMILLMVGCRSTQDADDVPNPEDVISDTGTVRYVDLEGGFYGLIADDSTHYLPDSLDDSFRQDGLRVRFRAQIREDVMTMQMWGRPVRILDIARLEMDG
jgi:uncharacterized protein YceK